MRRLPVVPSVLALVAVLRAWLPLVGSAQTFANGVDQGLVDPATFHVTEGSGLVASRQNPGVVWTHNDGDTWQGSIFAISTNGSYLGRFYLPTLPFGDYEDIAIGPGPNPEFQYIYFGAIGDNFSSRPEIHVYRFPEPAAYGYLAASVPFDQPLEGVQDITLTYPDGSYNAEALMIDPLTGDLFIANKLSDRSRIYRASRAQLDSGAPVQLSFVREISANSVQKVSAGDISPDGRLIIMRKGGKAWRWSRGVGQSVGDALANAGVEIPVVSTEPNGEAIGFHPTGLGYYTHSENDINNPGQQQPLHFYRRTDAVPRQPVVFVKPGETWRYQDTGTDESAAWRQTNFNDSAWSSGAGQFGYGQGDEATVISFGPDDFIKNTNTYFRKQFTNNAPSVTLSNLALRVCFNDGIAVYLNGVEVLRRNLATNAGYANAALGDNSAWQNVWFSSPVAPSLIRNGTNTLAVEVHRFDPSGPSLSFDLQLLEGPLESLRRFTTGPRLTNNLCLISVAGPVGSVLTIEASANLQSWSLAGQTVLINGTNLFQEAIAPGTEQRFYRIRQ